MKIFKAQPAKPRRPRRPRYVKKNRFTKQYRELVTRLKTARLEAGLAQEKAAELLESSQAYVSNIETGQQRVDIVELAAIAKVYKKPITYFLSSL